MPQFTTLHVVANCMIKYEARTRQKNAGIVGLGRAIVYQLGVNAAMAAAAKKCVCELLGRPTSTVELQKTHDN